MNVVAGYGKEAVNYQNECDLKLRFRVSVQHSNTHAKPQNNTQTKKYAVTDQHSIAFTLRALLCV